MYSMLYKHDVYRSSHYFDNITISFQQWNASYSAKYMQGIDFDLNGHIFRIATGAEPRT